MKGMENVMGDIGNIRPDMEEDMPMENSGDEEDRGSDEKESMDMEDVEEILLRLPAASQARCRAVCRTWLAIAEDAGFARRSFLQSVNSTHTSSTSTPPLYACRFYPTQDSLLTNLRPAWTTRLPLYKALKVELSFLPKVFRSSETSADAFSACGFMCIHRRVDDRMHVCVVNPINQSFKVLPVHVLRTVRRNDVTLLMGTAIATGRIPNFKVVLRVEKEVGDIDVAIYVYSSVSGEWMGILEGDEQIWHPNWMDTFVCNGELYRTVHSNPPRLVRLSTQPGPRYQWDIELPRFNKGRRKEGIWENQFFIAEYRGRLLCCCAGIWMLDDAGQGWVHIAGSCPLHILLPAPHVRPPYVDGTLWLRNVHVVGHLAVFFYRVENYDTSGGELDCPVAYDMLRHSWRKVPHALMEVEEFFQPMPNVRL